MPASAVMTMLLFSFAFLSRHETGEALCLAGLVT
jgi:hypothetical protein